MSTATLFTYLLAALLTLGCSAPKPLDVEVLESSAKENSRATSKTQVLSKGGSKFCEITGDGEVWIHGDKKGSIESNGDIWVAGENEGSVENDGAVWKAGNQIGTITKDREVWVEGNKMGEIENDGTIWRNGNSVGKTTGGDPRHAAIVFFFDFFGKHE